MAVKVKKGNLLSIVINNEFIKIADITKSAKSIVVHKVITVETPEGCYGDGVIKDRGALATAIKVALDNAAIQTPDVVFSVASSKIATKDVVIPAVKTSQIMNIINANASDYFPVDINEHIIQYTVIGKFEEDGAAKLKLNVMAAPTDMISVYYDLAANLALRVVSIDYVGNSSCQILQKQIDNATSVVIQVENDSTIVNIYNNYNLEMQRTIPYGKSLVVNEIMEKKKVKYDEALKLVQEQQLIHGEFDGDEITDSLRYLVSNINRIIDYYGSKRNGALIEKSYITGNAITMKGLITLLNSELRLDLKEITTLKGVNIDKKAYIPDEDVPSYLLNFGAVEKPVNFIPGDVVVATETRDYSKNIKVIFAGAIVIAAVLVIVPYAKYVSMQSDLNDVNRQVKQYEGIQDVVNEYYKANDINTDIKSFNSVAKGNNDQLQDFISNLEKSIPSDVSLNNLSINNGQVAFSGTASSKETLTLLITQLRGMEHVSDVAIGSESETKDAGNKITVSFAITCSLTAE